MMRRLVSRARCNALASGARKRSVAHTLSTSSLRAQRRSKGQHRSPSTTVIPREGGDIQYAVASRLNHGLLWSAGSPGRSRGDDTDCMVADMPSPSSRRDFARALLRHSTLLSKRAQGRPGAGLAPAVRCAKMHTQENRTAAYRWCQSLGLPCAMVGRLMPCSPGSRVPSGLPRLAKLDDAVRPVGLARTIRKSLTVATTARTTRFCRTHGPPFRRSFSSPVDGAGNLQTRRSLTAPLVRHEASGSRRAIRPALSLSHPTLPRPPQARLANMTTTRSPLKDEPGWATHTPIPNFGKVEYFCLAAD